MAHKLLQDGDPREKANWPYLSSDFPNYETFWQTVIVPLRAHNSLNLKAGLDPTLERIAMIHYTIFRCMGKVRGLLAHESLGFDFFDEAFLNLDRAVALAVEFLSLCDSMWRRLSQIGVIDYSTLAVGRKDLWRSKRKRLDGIGKDVNNYRDLVAHDTVLPMYYAEGKYWLPRAEFLPRENSPLNENTWSAILAKVSFPSDCEPAFDLVDRLARELLHVLNDLWPQVITEFNAIAQTDQYQRWSLTGAYEPPVSLVTGGPDRTQHLPSGTYVDPRLLTISNLTSETLPTSGSTVFAPPSVKPSKR